MYRRIPTALAFGVVAALSVGAARTAEAQGTTSDSSRSSATSSQRIPVRKDTYGNAGYDNANASANGRRMTKAQRDSAAAQARADSIAAANAAMERARQDSINAANAAIERARQDSINAANAAIERARQDSIARADSIAREKARADSIAAAEAARRKMMGRWGGAEFRIGGGAAMPMSDTKDFFNTGFDGTVGVGYHPGTWPVGIRFDGNYDRLGAKTIAGVKGKSQAIWSGAGELVLGLPPMFAVSPYAVGGGGLYHFSDVPDVNGNSSSLNKFGWNVGAGIGFGMGGAKLFVESRYTRVNLGDANGGKVTFLPVIVGITLR